MDYIFYFNKVNDEYKCWAEMRRTHDSSTGKVADYLLNVYIKGSNKAVHFKNGKNTLSYKVLEILLREAVTLCESEENDSCFIEGEVNSSPDFISLSSILKILNDNFDGQRDELDGQNPDINDEVTKEYNDANQIYHAIRSLREDKLKTGSGELYKQNGGYALKPPFKVGIRLYETERNIESVENLREIVDRRGFHRSEAINESRNSFEQVWKASFGTSFAFDERLKCEPESCDEISRSVCNDKYAELKNTLLLGDGGSGKTTWLLTLWKNLLDECSEGGPVPFYVPLYNCKGDRSFIKRYIKKKYFANDEERLPDNFFDKINSVVLLDGINEARSPDTLQDEIEEISSHATVIMCSRNDYLWPCLDGFLRAKMKHLNSEIVEEVLDACGMSTSVDEETMQLLQLPLFLKIYISVKGGGNVHTKGELLKKYDEWLLEQFGKSNPSDADKSTFEKFIRRQLPEYAHNSGGRTFAIEFFDNESVEKEKAALDRLQVTGLFRKISEDDYEATYAFAHEYYADYYKAKYIALQLGWVKHCALKKPTTSIEIPSCLTDRIPNNIARMVGEICGECNCDDGTSPIEELLHLDGFLERRYDKISRIAVANLVDIMKASRKSRLSANFTSLDMRNCNFADITLLNCDFSNSKISESAFFETIDSEIYELAVTNTGDIVVVTKNNELIVFDEKTRSCVYKRVLYRSGCYRIYGNIVAIVAGYGNTVEVYNTDTAQITEYNLNYNYDGGQLNNGVRLIDFDVKQNIFTSYSITANFGNVVQIADLNSNTSIRARIDNLKELYKEPSVIAIKAMGSCITNIVIQHQQARHTAYTSVVLKICSDGYEVVSENTRIIDSNAYSLSKGTIECVMSDTLYDLYSLNEIEISAGNENDIIAGYSFSENRNSSVFIMTGRSICNPRIYYFHNSDTCVQALEFPKQAQVALYICALSQNGKYFCLYPKYWLDLTTRITTGRLLVFRVEKAEGFLFARNCYTIPVSSDRAPLVSAWDLEHTVFFDDCGLLRVFNGNRISSEFYTKPGTHFVWIDSERFFAWNRESVELFKYSDGKWVADGIHLCKKYQQIKSLCYSSECRKAFALVCESTSSWYETDRAVILEFDMNGTEISTIELLTINNEVGTIKASNDGNYIMAITSDDDFLCIYHLNKADCWEQIKTYSPEGIIHFEFLSNTRIIITSLLCGTEIYDLKGTKAMPFNLLQTDVLYSTMLNGLLYRIRDSAFAVLNKKEGFIYLLPDDFNKSFVTIGTLVYAEINGCYIKEYEVAKIGIMSDIDSITVSVSNDDNTAFVTTQGNRVHMIRISPDYYIQGPRWYPPLYPYSDQPIDGHNSDYKVLKLSSVCGMVNCRFSESEVDCELFESNGATVV